MHLFGIIPDEVVHELPIEVIRLVQEISVPVGKLLLDGTVETFQMGVRLWMARIIEVMHQVLLLAGLAEVL